MPTSRRPASVGSPTEEPDRLTSPGAEDPGTENSGTESSGTESSGTEAIRGFVDDVRRLFQQELRTADSGAEAMRAFVDDMRELLPRELRTAQEELAGKARAAVEGVLFLGVGVVLGAVAAGTSTAVIMRMLEKVLPPTVAAAIVTIVVAAAAAVLVAMGLEKVRRVFPLLPERALDELREEIRGAMPG
ncbi:phage holin family protein [Pseudonocardia kujensis]|uniref:phage holin family protein n=1 Tax=Pseudonocardia kujensis TaxID=1128675 RepID=UPI001E3780CF|nr:phage holin family protein [Pseudonocardia kujensis]MCE0766107.1 phage holin family protein [Pseudonocardia kujensis]